MKYIFLHGLGQTEKSWTEVQEKLEEKELNNVDYQQLLENKDVTYQNIYDGFCHMVNETEGKVNLCGLSLGSIIALNYAVDYPKKVNSLVLIAPQYKMPKGTLKVQNIIFKILPKKVFNSFGFTKQEVLTLTTSMMDLDFEKKLDQLNMKTLIVCGSKDKANIDSARKLDALIKSSHLEIIEDGKHELNVDKPIELADVLNEFYI